MRLKQQIESIGKHSVPQPDGLRTAQHLSSKEIRDGSCHGIG